MSASNHKTMNKIINLNVISHCYIMSHVNQNDQFILIFPNIYRNVFFSLKEGRRTRGHGVTLAKKQCRLDITKF